MIEINGYDIELTRGDTLRMRVNLNGCDLPEGTDAVFTVKKSVRSDEVLLRKRFDASDEVLSIVLSPAETCLEPGSYVWDVRLQIPLETGGYEVYTPMEYAAFVVLAAVGDDMGTEEDPGLNPDLPVLQLVLKEARDAIRQAQTAAENANAAALAAQPCTVPSFWAAEVERAISTVREKQDACGVQGVCFAFCSDMHIHDNDQNYARNLGVLAAAVMDQADVPLMLNCGDLLTNDSVAQEAWLKPCYDRAWTYLKPVRNRLLLLQGNHDGAWGAYSSSDTSGAYSKNIPPQKLWQYLFRPQTASISRVCGPTGAYFYADLTAQKTRFICLNSHDGQWNQNEDGTAVWNTMTGGYTQQQLEWLAQEALNVQEGWMIILASHIPPTGQLPIDYSGIRCTDLLRGVVSAYARRGMYAGSYAHDAQKGENTWADASISVDFTEARGEIVGWFAGHAHRDAIVEEDLPFPIITITCAANASYDETEPERTLDSASETALDFVTVDALNRTIHLTRVGVGEDRSCSFTAQENAPLNQLPFAVDDDGSIFNGTGWMDGYRISASSGTVSANAATDLTGYIPVSIGDTVSFANIILPEKTPNVGVHFYSARNGSSKLLSVVGWDGDSGFPGNNWTYTSDGTNVTSFVVPDWTELAGVAYMRLAASEITAESIITVEAAE